MKQRPVAAAAAKSKDESGSGKSKNSKGEDASKGKKDQGKDKGKDKGKEKLKVDSKPKEEEEEWDENFNWLAWIPISSIIIISIGCFALCWPPAHLWNQPVNHAADFYNWHWGVPVYHHSTTKLHTVVESLAHIQEEERVRVRALYDQLSESHTGRLNVYGAQGVGKSQTVLRYIDCVASNKVSQECPIKPYDTVLWLEASSITSMELQYRLLADHLHLLMATETTEDAVDRVLSWLYRQKRALLVIDGVPTSTKNVDDYDRFIPNNHEDLDTHQRRVLHVLYTSRKEIFPKNFKIKKPASEVEQLPVNRQWPPAALYLVAGVHEAKGAGEPKVLETRLESLSQSMALAAGKEKYKTTVRWSLEGLQGPGLSLMQVLGVAWPAPVPVSLATSWLETKGSPKEVQPVISQLLTSGLARQFHRLEGSETNPLGRKAARAARNGGLVHSTLTPSLMTAQAMKTEVLANLSPSDSVRLGLNLLELLADSAPWKNPNSHPYWPSPYGNTEKGQPAKPLTVELGTILYHTRYYKHDVTPRRHGKFTANKLPASETLVIVFEAMKFIEKSLKRAVSAEGEGGEGEGEGEGGGTTAATATQATDHAQLISDVVTTNNIKLARVLDVLSQAAWYYAGVLKDLDSALQLADLRLSISTAITSIPPQYHMSALRDIGLFSLLKSKKYKARDQQKLHLFKETERMYQQAQDKLSASGVARKDIQQAILTAEQGDLFLERARTRQHDQGEMEAKARKAYESAIKGTKIIGRSAIHAMQHARMGTFLSFKQEHQNAIFAFEKAKTVYAQALGGEYSMEAMNVHREMVPDWLNMKRSREGLKVQEKALNIAKQRLNAHDPLLADIMVTVAQLTLKVANTRSRRNGVRMLQDVVEMQLEAGGEAHQKVADALTFVANAHGEMGQLDKSLENLFRVYKIYNNMLGPKDSQTLMLKQRCVDLYNRIKVRNEEARQRKLQKQRRNKNKK